MTEFFAFAGQHPFLTWFLAWGIWPVCWMVTAVLTAPFSYGFRAFNRMIRGQNIQAQGWPTNPLTDADGDIVHPKKEESR